MLHSWGGGGGSPKDDQRWYRTWKWREWIAHIIKEAGLHSVATNSLHLRRIYSLLSGPSAPPNCKLGGIWGGNPIESTVHITYCFCKTHAFQSQHWRVNLGSRPMPISTQNFLRQKQCISGKKPIVFDYVTVKHTFECVIVKHTGSRQRRSKALICSIAENAYAQLQRVS